MSVAVLECFEEMGLMMEEEVEKRGEERVVAVVGGLTLRLRLWKWAWESGEGDGWRVRGERRLKGGMVGIWN